MTWCGPRPTKFVNYMYHITAGYFNTVKIVLKCSDLMTWTGRKKNCFLLSTSSLRFGGKII
jgi:hypothetical protein